MENIKYFCAPVKHKDFYEQVCREIEEFEKKQNKNLHKLKDEVVP